MEETYVLALPALILATLLFFFFIARSRKGAANLPPGSRGWPILGQALQFMRASRRGDPQSFVRERRLKYDSRVFRTALLTDDVAVFCTPQGNKFLFGNENKLVSLWWHPSIRRLFGRCLINSSGDEAKRQRKMLLTFLAPDAMLRYVTAMDEVTRHHFANLWNEEVIKVYPTVKLYTFQLACRLFTSIEDAEKITKLAAEFDAFVKGMMEIPLNFPGTRFYKAMNAAHAIRKELHMVAMQRREALAQKKASPSQDLLSYMLVTPDENGKFLAEDEIVNNILTLLFAGHDTSTSTSTMLVKYLAELPDVYKEVLKEQMDIAMSKGPGELLQWEDIQKMRYSWNVVCEVMRLTPPVPGNFREALADFTYEGYTIPKGWKLYWSTVTHKDPSLFPSPEKFDPSRFEEAGASPFSYTPFGGGPRMCIGKEYARIQILVFLHNLIKKFRWDLVIPGEFIKYDPMPVPEQGLPIRLQLHDWCKP